MGFTKDIIGTNESVGGINLFEKVQSTQPATPYTAGLMSATDKSKLDSLENYVHPDSGVVPGKYMQVDVNGRRANQLVIYSIGGDVCGNLTYERTTGISDLAGSS